MIANAVRLDPKSADLKVEMAYQFYLSGNFSRAYDCYQVPTSLLRTRPPPPQGHCWALGIVLL